MGKRKSNFFVYDCGTRYSNCHLVFLTTKLTMFEVETGIQCNNILLDHHNNVLIAFFYTCRSAHLNMNGHTREQECIKCLISEMRMRLPTICFPYSVSKG